MKKTVIITTLLLLSFAANALAGSYNYLDPADFKVWLESGKKVQIVDIQVPADFQKHHFKGAIETNAYPVKSVEDKQKLDKVLPLLSSAEEEIVIVCPRGGGGAKNTYDHLKEKGVPAARLLILEDGMQGWPYPMLVAASGR